MSGRKLLLADDSVTIQKVVNLTFAEEDIEVIAVGDGDAAMKSFVEAAPDLVMVDVNMPGLDGYRICEMIKQDAETKHIPVILLVGSFEPFDQSEAERVGADDFLTKPFQSIRQLVNKVTDLLGDKAEENFFLPIENQNDDSTIEAAGETPSAETADEIENVFSSDENLGDAAMDDEMIQTSQIADAVKEETIAYESEPVDDAELIQESDDDSELAEESQSFDDSSVVETSSVEETEQVAAENSETEFSDVEAEHSAANRSDNESPASESANVEARFSDDEYSEPPIEAEEDLAETQPLSSEYLTEVMAAEKPSETNAVPVLNFDDADLLEFPKMHTESGGDDNRRFLQINSEIFEKNADGGETLAAADEIENKIDEFSERKTENFADANQSKNLSPETIEAIADKVVEKIASRFIERIVREVIAQMEEKK